MKTKVILESQNEYAKQSNKEFEKEYIRAMLIALLEDKKISRTQYDECRKRLKIEQKFKFFIKAGFVCDCCRWQMKGAKRTGSRQNFEIHKN